MPDDRTPDLEQEDDDFSDLPPGRPLGASKATPARRKSIAEAKQKLKKRLRHTGS
jgi:hypothetical protein